MRVISAAIHRVLDYITVVVLALAPTLLHFTDVPAKLSYALAIIHLLMTLLTRFYANGKGVIPLRAHGFVELIVGILLSMLPFIAGWAGAPRAFYCGAGITFIVVWLLTDYTEHPSPANR